VESTGITTGFRLVIMGMLTLWLLAAAAYAQSEGQVLFQNLLDEPAHLEKSGPLPEQHTPADYLSPGLHRALQGELAASHWWQTGLRDPLPPASVFAMQANLCKYLDTWPTPGLTVSPEQPPSEELTDDDLM
jgi:hypothetical protein